VKLLALFFLLAAGSSTAPAQAAQTHYDCSARRMVRQPILQHFTANELSTSWSAELGGGISLIVSAIPLGEESRRALAERGMLDRAVWTSFSFTTANREPDAASVEIRAGDRALPPVPFVRDRFEIGAARVPAEQMSPLLAGDAELIAVFRDRQGRAMRQVALPVALIREALGELPAMFRRYRENIVDPPNRCALVIVMR
jgi:hypothetical protein